MREMLYVHDSVARASVFELCPSPPDASKKRTSLPVRWAAPLEHGLRGRVDTEGSEADRLLVTLPVTTRSACRRKREADFWVSPEAFGFMEHLTRVFANEVEAGSRPDAMLLAVDALLSGPRLAAKLTTAIARGGRGLPVRAVMWSRRRC